MIAIDAASSRAIRSARRSVAWSVSIAGGPLFLRIPNRRSSSAPSSAFAFASSDAGCGGGSAGFGSGGLLSVVATIGLAGISSGVDATDAAGGGATVCAGGGACTTRFTGVTAGACDDGARTAISQTSSKPASAAIVSIRVLRMPETLADPAAQKPVVETASIRYSRYIHQPGSLRSLSRPFVTPVAQLPVPPGSTDERTTGPVPKSTVI